MAPHRGHPASEKFMRCAVVPVRQSAEQSHESVSFKAGHEAALSGPTSVPTRLRSLRLRHFLEVEISESLQTISLSSAECTNVFHELAAEVRNPSEYSASNHVALDVGKPDFDLIQPG
jgi:hypothetical protein